MEITPTQSTLQPADKYTPVQVAGLRLLARGDYALADVTSRLIKKGFDPIEVTQDLKLLVSKKWIDDKRLASNIYDYYKGQKGNIFIRQKMGLKQIPRQIINQFFENLKDMDTDNQKDPIDYKTIKRKLAARYEIADWQKLDPKIKNKIYGYLARQGFNNIQSIMSQLAA